MARRLPVVLTAAALGIALAACGGGDDAVEPVQTPTVVRQSIPCSGAAVRATKLPRSFPAVEGVTFTKTQTAGPTQIVDGYFEGTLRSAYERYKAAFRKARYHVIFDEIEARDSEVSYIGGGRTGQVALRAICRERGRLAVHVTSRPE